MKFSKAWRETAENLVRQMTLEEKIGMVHGNGLFRTEGVERLGIPPLTMSDGPMGVRNEFENGEWKPIGNTDDYVTYLPSNSALAATWNRGLAYKMGQVLGEEARGRGKDIILAPGVNIKRSPLCGRNFEYFSEDPYLTKEQAVPYINGVQEADTSACIKHFAVNNQETRRLEVNVEVSDRALKEIYFPAFRAAVDAGVNSVMGAYNQLRGEFCCQSKLLLNQILRKEWGFNGLIVSDWGAVHNTELAAESELDLEMSVTNNFDEYFMAKPLQKAIEEGRIPESLLDEKVIHILMLMQKLYMLDGARKSGCYNTPEHRQIALEAARESVVLLKNEGSRLPLNRKKLKKLLVIGDNAERIHSNGGGSAEIKALYEISPLMGLKSKLGGNTAVKYVRGYCPDPAESSADDVNWQEASLRELGKKAVSDAPREVLRRKREALREEAVRLAAEYEDVILFAGLNHDCDLEGYDRPGLQLPYEQDELIREVLKANPRAVIVVIAGSPVDMGAWKDRTQAIVWGWYAGIEGGNAMAEVLLGETNPSGKLPETFPNSLSDCPAHTLGEFPGGDTVRYGEGVYVGYRYFDTYSVEPQFCFGHGLSYTEFKYENLRAEMTEGEIDVQVKVSCDVTNTGSIAGKETVQLYVRDGECSTDRPAQELKGFVKLELAPGETATAEFILDRTSFAFYDERANSWSVEPGSFLLTVNSSSRNKRLEREIELKHAYRFAD